MRDAGPAVVVALAGAAAVGQGAVRAGAELRFEFRRPAGEGDAAGTCAGLASFLCLGSRIHYHLTTNFTLHIFSVHEPASPNERTHS